MSNPQPGWIDPLPTGAPDIEGMYERSVPRLWPRGVRFREKQIWLHRQAFGASLSALARTIWWVANRYMPHRDTGDYPVFMHLWEEMFGQKATGITATRIKRVLAAWRTRGTLIEALLLAIFAPVFGTSDATDLACVRARPSDVTANGGDVSNPDHETYYLVNLVYLHVYSISGTLTPDRAMGDELAARIRRSGTIITYAASRYMEYGPGPTWYDAGTYGPL